MIKPGPLKTPYIYRRLYGQQPAGPGLRSRANELVVRSTRRPAAGGRPHRLRAAHGMWLDRIFAWSACQPAARSAARVIAAGSRRRAASLPLHRCVAHNTPHPVRCPTGPGHLPTSHGALCTQPRGEALLAIAGLQRPRLRRECQQLMMPAQLTKPLDPNVFAFKISLRCSSWRRPSSKRGHRRQRSNSGVSRCRPA